MRNRTMIQFFEWFLPSNASLWREAQEKAKELSNLGISDIWLPPAYKGDRGINDVGYGVYDMYDLGEFNQKGSVPTKYGTKDEYINAIKALKRSGIKVYADIVFNHRMGGDETELVKADVYDFSNRGKVIEEREIATWTKFNFTARNNKYSDFKWNQTHFDGCDWDEIKKQKALYLFKGKSWDNQVDIENGNYDYLLGTDLDLNNSETYEELVRWGKWYLDVTSVDGFRLDAVKHMNFSSIMSWLREMRMYSGRDLFAVGEYWNQSLSALVYYLDKTANRMRLFDVPLHYNFHKASRSGGQFDMSKIFSGSLVSQRPKRAVTLVDNHDTQPGQSLQSWVDGWFKLHAYSLILLREEGLPCVFYGDLYGVPHDNISAVGIGLNKLLKVRYDLAYGEQIDYFYDSSVIGFTRMGEDELLHSGLAVVMTDSIGGSIKMCVGEKFIGKTFVDCLGNSNSRIVIEADGCADFTVKDGSVSVYVDEDYLISEV